MSLRNRQLIGFKIWYSNGKIITSRDSKWTDAPQGGVQVVKMFYSSDNGIEVNVHSKQEYYLLDAILKLPKEIKTGKAIRYERFIEILTESQTDEEIVSDLNE